MLQKVTFLCNLHAPTNQMTGFQNLIIKIKRIQHAAYIIFRIIVDEKGASIRDNSLHAPWKLIV